MLLVADPPRATAFQVVGHQQRGRDTVHHPVPRLVVPASGWLHDLVTDDERGRGELRDPGLDPDRPWPKLQLHAVVELVPGDDDTVFETGHSGITPAGEHHYDARFLTEAQTQEGVEG